MADKFETTIDKFVIDTKEKMLIVARESISAVIEDAQTLNGKMPVDTGFLRASGVAALNKIPVGPTEGRAREAGEVGVLPDYALDNGAVQGSSVEDSLIRMKIGDTFIFGWTAKYARTQEAYNGFLASAMAKWPNFVNASIKRFRK